MVATTVVPFAISALTIVPDAPLESVMVTFFLEKSIPLSCMISEPTSIPDAVWS